MGTLCILMPCDGLYATRTLGKTKRYCLDFHVNTARSVRVPSPSLPLRLHKEKGGETLIFIAFLLPQICSFLSTSIKLRSKGAVSAGSTALVPRFQRACFSSDYRA
jgi:hypothetical protein